MAEEIPIHSGTVSRDRCLAVAAILGGRIRAPLSGGARVRPSNSRHAGELSSACAGLRYGTEREESLFDRIRVDLLSGLSGVDSRGTEDAARPGSVQAR